MAEEKKYPPGRHPNSLANLKKGGWKPGQSGNPEGRPPNIKYVSEALRERLVKGELDNVTLADLLADSLINRAKKSNVALNILLDRTEGKVTQSVEAHVDTDVTWVIGKGYEDKTSTDKQDSE